MSKHTGLLPLIGMGFVALYYWFWGGTFSARDGDKPEDVVQLGPENVVQPEPENIVQLGPENIVQPGTENVVQNQPKPNAIFFDPQRIFRQYDSELQNYWDVGGKVSDAQRRFNDVTKGRPATRKNMEQWLHAIYPLVDLARSGNYIAASYAASEFYMGATFCMKLNWDLPGWNRPEIQQFFMCLGKADFLVDIVLERKDLERHLRTAWIYKGAVQRREKILRDIRTRLNGAPAGITSEQIKQWYGEGYYHMKSYYNGN